MNPTPNHGEYFCANLEALSWYIELIRLNSSPRAAADFWEARSLWEPTWNKDTDDSHLQVDYVRVYAL